MVRESLWIPILPTNTNLGVASTAVLINVSSAGLLALRPFTIVRVRGSMLVNSDQETTSEFYQAALGYAVVSDQAAAIGVTAVPTPFTDQGSDLWHVYEATTGQVRVSSAIGIWEAGISKDYDSRGMRKVEDGQTSIQVIESSSISLGCNVGHTGRFLIKLH